MNNNKKVKEILFIVIPILLVAAVVFGILFFLNQKKATPVVSEKEVGKEELTDENGDAYEYNSKIRNILFLGIDKKGDLVSEAEGRNGGQSDCMILLSLNTETKTATMLNISRDSMTDVEVYGSNGDYLSTEYAQITLQYAYGDGEKKSCWLTKKAVSALLCDLPIHNYVAMNIDGIAAINDALGGVTITVPEDYTAIDPVFEAGATITLTGAQAEEYTRSRDINVAGSNNGRMQRQNQFLTAMLSQLKSKAAGNDHLVELMVKAAQPFMITDLTADEMKSLADYEVDTTFVTLPGEDTQGESFGMIHDQFIVNQEETGKIMKEMFYISK